MAIINYIPLLACQLGADLFDTKLGPQCMKWLEDSVYSIREAATKNLQKLAQEFGPEWAKDHLVGRVSEPNHTLKFCTDLRYVGWTS